MNPPASKSHRPAGRKRERASSILISGPSSSPGGRRLFPAGGLIPPARRPKSRGVSNSSLGEAPFRAGE